MSRRRVIWLTILGVMVLGYLADRLTFGGFCLLVFIGVSLVKMFDPDPVDVLIDGLTRRTAKAAANGGESDEPDADEEVIRVRRRTIEALRNSLLRHHNARTTDKDYQTSKMGRDTLDTIQKLNKALERPRLAE
jgi:hypothetical protein